MEANKRLNVACLQKAQQDNDIHVSTAREHRFTSVIVPKKKMLVLTVKHVVFNHRLL